MASTKNHSKHFAMLIVLEILSSVSISSLIGYGDWKLNGADEEILKVKEWNIKNNLYLSIVHLISANVKDSAIMTKLIGVSFPYLKSLKLAENQLESLELICRLSAPKL